MPTVTYTPIASRTITTASTDVTFTNIPSTYRDLIIVVRDSGGQGLPRLRFNNLSLTQYNSVWMSGNGSTTSSSSESNASAMKLFGVGIASNHQMIIQVFDYATTDKNKAVLCRNDVSSAGTDAIAGRWERTTAITEVNLVDTAGSGFGAGSTFAIYGVIA